MSSGRWKSRLKEPSTWAGFAALGSLFGVKELVAFGAPEIATALAALAAVLLSEKGQSTDPGGD